MAYAAQLDRTVSLPRSRVYAHLAAFGDVGKLVPDEIDSVEMKGEGVGGARHVRLKGVPGVLVERLEALVENKLMSYSLLEAGGLPIGQYHAVVELDDAPNGGTAIRWASNWVAKGAPDAEVRAMLTGLYGRLIDGIVRLG